MPSLSKTKILNRKGTSSFSMGFDNERTENLRNIITVALILGLMMLAIFLGLSINADALLCQYTNINNTLQNEGNLDDLHFNGTSIWVTGSANDKIYSINASGSNLTGPFSISGAGATISTAIYNNNSLLFVGDSGKDLVYTFLYNGTNTTLVINLTNAGITNIAGIAGNSTNLFIADDTNNRVYYYLMNGTNTSSSFDLGGSGNGNPSGIAFNYNTFFVADQADDQIYEYNSAGVFTGIATRFDRSMEDFITGISSFDNQTFYLLNRTGGFIELFKRDLFIIKSNTSAGATISDIASSSCQTFNLSFSSPGRLNFTLSLPRITTNVNASFINCNYNSSNALLVKRSNITNGCELFVVSDNVTTDDTLTISIGPLSELRIFPSNLPAAIAGGTITALIIVYAIARKRKSSEGAD